MLKYSKAQLVMISMLGLLGSAIAFADEPIVPQPKAAQGADKNSNPSPMPKQPRGLYGPMSFSYIEIDGLDLSAKQETLWEHAQDKAEEAAERVQTINRDLRDQIRVDLDKPGIDLKRVIQRQQEARTKIDTMFRQAREAWFIAYDSLNAEQKEQLREAIRDGMDALPVSLVPPPPPPPSLPPPGKPSQ